jgi:hypothetical protein
MRHLLGIALLSLAVALGTAAWGQENTSTTTPNTGVKHDLKTAGRATKNAAKKTGRKTESVARTGARETKHTTKSIVHKGARKTRHTSTKVEHKTTTGTEPQ